MEARTATPLLNGRFLVLESIGRGGMGTVYRAFDRAEERVVALKILQTSRPAGPGHPLAEEFRVWTRLGHPNIVRAYGLGRVATGPFRRGTPYLVLEYFEGRPAHQVLPAGRIAVGVLERLARRILRGLAHIHEHGLVHRDLKPGNVLVEPAARGPGRVKITDFGLAAVSGRSGRPGELSGSIPYVAPESILGRPVDGRADLYALGVLLFHLTTGRLPFSGDDADAALRWHLERRPADPASARPGLPETWRMLVRTLTSRDPGGRPSSARKALRLLGADVGTERPHGPAPPTVHGGSQIRRSIDRIRLGGSAFRPLPDDDRSADRIVDDARVACHLLGVAFHRLKAGASPRESLGRLVLELLMERESGVRGLVVKYALHRGLPLELLGGLPVWDRVRAAGPAAPRDHHTERLVARGVAAFLADTARTGPIALAVDRSTLVSPLVREMVRRLVEVEIPAASSGRVRGGLLLLAHRRPGRYHRRGAAVTMRPGIRDRVLSGTTNLG